MDPASCFGHSFLFSTESPWPPAISAYHLASPLKLVLGKTRRSLIFAVCLRAQAGLLTRDTVTACVTRSPAHHRVDIKRSCRNELMMSSVLLSGVSAQTHLTFCARSSARVFPYCACSRLRGTRLLHLVVPVSCSRSVLVHSVSERL